jgi:hypothetical protein
VDALADGAPRVGANVPEENIRQRRASILGDLLRHAARMI